MPRISHIKLGEDELKEMTNHFSFLISSLNDSKNIENFLNDFFTREEKLMLTKRLVLIMMIKRGYSTPAIQNALRMSYETIRTYSNQVPLKNKLFQNTIQKLINREKTEEFFDKLEKVLEPLGHVLKAKTNMKSRAKFTP